MIKKSYAALLRLINQRRDASDVSQISERLNFDFSAEEISGSKVVGDPLASEGRNRFNNLQSSRIMVRETYQAVRDPIKTPLMALPRPVAC